jgi:EpsD family peptidyl-prolyl cis-trans isomerase
LGLALAACSPRAPEGQVIAVVNGEEVTRRELMGEWQASGAQSDARPEAVAPLLLESLVDRKLLAEEARRLEIQQTPDYLMNERRLRERLLVDGLRTRLAQDWLPPTKEEIASFIAANPQMFGGRKLLIVDRISVSNPPDPGQLPSSTFRGNSELAEELRSRNIGFSRELAVMDTLSMSREEAEKRERRTARLEQQDDRSFTSDTIRAVLDAPKPQEEWPEIARAELIKWGQAHAVEALLHSLRSKARVQYQSGFGPARRPARTNRPIRE